MKARTGRIAAIAASAALTFSALLPATAGAQQDGLRLEEIVVTAQRREQSLQEVPISIEAFSGLEIQQQGYRTMDDLAEFSPTIEIDTRMQDQNISIRGIGTAGSSLMLEQAAPTFVDGVLFGRTSMVKAALVDLERIEVLRGPQPVYFGASAVAGAFNLVTKKPTPEWQGDIRAEFGNYNRRTLEGGVGGPLSDTVGIRFAGKYDETDGFLKDVITGDDFPERRDLAGRVTLRWTPNDSFRATARVGISDTEQGPEPVAVCLGRGYEELDPANIPDRDSPDPPHPRAGQPWMLDRDALVPGRTSFDQLDSYPPLCDSSGPSGWGRKGLKTDTWFTPPIDVSEEDASGTGMIDAFDVALAMRQAEYGEDLSSYDDLESTNAYLDLEYTLPNGIQLSSLTGHVDYYRAYFRINSYSPFFNNARIRDEDLRQVSQEFRISSAPAAKVQWMIGAYWQDNDLDLISDSLEAGLRRPRRYNEAWEEATWKSLFAAVTFNFMDDKASLDIGGRWSDVEKEGFIQGWGARYVFAEEPDGPGSCATYVNEDDEVICEPAVTTSGQAGFTQLWRERQIPVAWASPNTQPIGFTALDPDIRRNTGPLQVPLEQSEFDPQVVFRYRPNEDLSLYAKYATAFKAGGYDSAVASLPGDESEFVFKPEQAEIWEIGAKGDFWDQRARYDVAIFNQEVEDLQLATIVTDIGGTGGTNVAVATNAGLQRVRGVEFSIDAALSQNLRARLAGAILDGEMVEYGNAGCTAAEFEVADTGPCITEEESIELVGDDELAGTIDRSGAPAPRTPDWKFALKLDYSRPLSNRFMGFADVNISTSDGYISNIEEFDLVQKVGKHTDMNVSIGFGPEDGTWRLSAWGRNLFGVSEEYNPQFDVRSDGIKFNDMSPSMYESYGISFQYNYR
ncbi:MAG: TonB-dependent receptor [Woeseiaceae bacterium]|nr:TonB-dependent receptor [Woeseiaceae bacterium]